MQTVLHNSPGTLVLLHRRSWSTASPLTGTTSTREVGKNYDFRQN